jgi:hypothetical protein
MKPVNGDALFLTAELCCRKMPRVVRRHCKKQGRDLRKEQYDVLAKGVLLHRRFLTGQYEADEDEILGLFAACQCVSDLDSEALGSPKKTLSMPVSAAFSANGPLPPPRAAYGDIMESIGGGILEGIGEES